VAEVEQVEAAVGEDGAFACLLTTAYLDGKVFAISYFILRC
jgi:hypothetical protein